MKEPKLNLDHSAKKLAILEENAKQAIENEGACVGIACNHCFAKKLDECRETSTSGHDPQFVHNAKRFLAALKEKRENEKLDEPNDLDKAWEKMKPPYEDGYDYLINEKAQEGDEAYNSLTSTWDKPPIGLVCAIIRRPKVQWKAGDGWLAEDGYYQIILIRGEYQIIDDSGHASECAFDDLEDVEKHVSMTARIPAAELHRLIAEKLEGK